MFPSAKSQERLEPHFRVFVGHEQDLPGAASAEELERQLHLKELDSRESIVVAISAYDGYVRVPS